MKHQFTKQDLVAYAYGDASILQIKATEHAFASDPALISELVLLVEAQAALPKIKFKPRRRILDMILRYARTEQKAQLCY